MRREPVTDLGSAQEAIRLIFEHGEEIGGGLLDYEDEIAHYFRFEQLLLGRYYRSRERHMGHGRR